MSEKNSWAGAMGASADYIISVTSIEPNDFYHFMEKPGPKDLPEKVNFWLGNYFCHTLGGRYNVGENIYVRPAGIVEEGLKDTQTLLYGLFSQENNIQPEQAAQITFNPSTINKIAQIAARPIGPEKSRGCPHALRNGEVQASPLFTKLSIWSGTLAIQAYFTHRRGINPTEVLEKGYEQRFYTRFATTEAADDRMARPLNPKPHLYNPIVSQ